jgi:hypothetical protein
VAPTRRHAAFTVTGLAALRARLQAANIPTIDGRPLPGFARSYATDPFGNRIEFLERINDETGEER